MVARPEIKAKELNWEQISILRQGRRYKEMDTLDSLIVHLRALNVGRHR